MRWDGQRVDQAVPDEELPGMPPMPGRLRVVRTPEFAGITFHEVAAKSALNKVPAASSMPFHWTVNPYRGCSHSCVYCFARGTHTYLDFDPGQDFDSQIVVKTNIGEVLRRELGRKSWAREHVALGTNTDPYQRAEGRYQLMPQVISALGDSGTPFSILTKGTVMARDLPLLTTVSASVPIGIGISLALLDDELQASLEPGTPSPKARLELIRRVRTAGLPCGVLVAPILPYLTDSVDQLTEVIGSLAAAGATGVSAFALHLRPGTKEWFLGWLGRRHPELVPRYRQLYGRGSYAPKEYRDELARRVRVARRGAGVGSFGSVAVRGVPGDDESWFPHGSVPLGAPPVPPPGEQLTLL